MLWIAKQAEERTAANKVRKKSKPSSITVQTNNKDLDMSETDASQVESDCIVGVCLRAYLQQENLSPHLRMKRY